MIKIRNFAADFEEPVPDTHRMKFSYRLSSLVIIFSVLLAFPIFAQNNKDSSSIAVDPMNLWLDYSRPGKFHQVLADLEGTWDFKGRHFTGNPNPDLNKVDIEFFGTCVRKPFANGRFFIVESVSGEGQIIQSPVQDGKFINDNAREITTEGYDNVKNKFEFTLIGNHLGSNILYFEGDYDSIAKTISSEFYTEWAPGMKWKERYYFVIQDNDHYKIEMFGEREGKIIRDTELDYTRVR